MPIDDDRRISFLLSDAARLLRTVFDRRVRKLGLTRSQWSVLRRLHRRPGANQSELAEMLEIEKASAGRLIDRLEANGWVERRADADDRRVNRLYLTAEAVRVNDRIEPISVATVEDALAGLSPMEREVLTELLDRVKERLLEMASDDVDEAGTAAAAEEFERRVANAP
ncbi:MAG: MarR family winged helix-turn-helix transcriptional regulator [Methyloligellaceae bacterium]